MAYQDPYTTPYAAGANDHYQNNRPQFVEPSREYSNTYPPHQPYENMVDETYTPYGTNPRGYNDERQPEDDYSYGENQRGYNNYPPVQRVPTSRSTSGLSKQSRPSVSVEPVRKEGSGFEQGEFTPRTPRISKNRTPKALREYRYDHQGNLWTKGGRGRCIGRVCCCSLMTTIFLIVSIVLALALWVRPPSIKIGDVQTMTENGSIIQQNTDGITINLGVDISVSNPNYFAVDFKEIKAEIFYPIENVPVGGGYASNIVFKSTSQTNFTFPFALTYNSTQDPRSAVILDLASKCGVSGGAKSNIKVNYKITLGIRIMLITISPVISNEFNFPCPLQPSDIQKFLGGSSGI
ncbi:hypothetical protein B0H34DRAFT_325584 [Crassisporium funariophilum]|nr:hypothetical protein B0H34DRAFT_325584 [Crassisporium funariophilum]